jgi:hypothetical protein
MIEGLAVYSIELWAASIVAHFTIRMRRKYESADSAHFGSGERRKKRNVDVANEVYHVAVPRADISSSVLVSGGGVGKRAKRLLS